jgi:acylglycerol lipase
MAGGDSNGISRRPPMTSSAATEQWLDGTGGRIFTRHWEPEGTPKAGLVLCHGVKAHGGQYLRVGEEFASRGFAVTALDLRGRGKSDGERFYIDSIDEYVADLALAIGFARSKQPRLPLYVLGHSAGGVTSVTYALDHQDEIDGLICESFAFRVFAPNFALKLLEGASHIVPHTHVLRLKMEDFSRDPEWVAQLKADPLTDNEVQPVATVAAFARAGERFEREFGRITLPLLILHGTADKATRPDGSEQFFKEAGSTDKTLKLYDGYAHDLLNDIGKEQVFDDVALWIEERLSEPQAVEKLEQPAVT